MRKGKFIVISGPSGVGKNTIADILVDKGYGIYSISMTTRKIRNGEIEGKDYFYVSEKEFIENISNDNFVEYAKYNDNYYGTLKSFINNSINKGINVIAVVDIVGGMNIKNAYEDANLIFIMPPSLNELERRLRNRNTDSNEDILKRLSIAKKEIDFKEHYDFIIINNDLNKCIDEIISIIK